MVQEKHIILAYRQLLGRDPESTSVINDHCQCQNLRELYAKIASSEEFKKKIWDYGVFSFECEKRGANVTSVDDFVWRNWETKERGYDLAHKILKSKAIKVQCPVEKLELPRRKLIAYRKSPRIWTGIGFVNNMYDIVLMLGVLYHVPDPSGYLRTARKLCKGMLILETHLDLLDYPRPALAYYKGDFLNGDATNFWEPNTAAVIGMLQDSGFKKIIPQPVFWSSRKAFHAYI